MALVKFHFDFLIFKMDLQYMDGPLDVYIVSSSLKPPYGGVCIKRLVSYAIKVASANELNL